MKSSEINAIFAQKVTEYLTAGYTINTNTMNGSQGEISKIDFRNDNEVIRVLLTQETIWGEHFRTSDAIVLTIGRCTDERVINEKGFGRNAIIWNERLEVIEKRIFFQIGRRNSDWYLEEKEAEAAINKHYERVCRSNRWEEENDHPRKDFSGDETVKKIILSAVRRHLEKPRMKADRIANIIRVWDESRYIYRVTTLGGSHVTLC